MQSTENAPKSKCLACGKDIIVRSTVGKGSVGYCSRVCASMKRYQKRFTGLRSQMYAQPVDIERKRSE